MLTLVPEEATMTLRENFHSTAVAWLKVALPLIALCILSTLFLVSRTVDPEAAIPDAKVDIAERVREPRLTLPTWAGMTEDGSALTVTASEARPGGGGTSGASAQTLHATLDLPDGGRIELVADTGRMQADGTRMTVTGGVVVTTPTGYRVTTDVLEARMDRTGLTSDSAVTATGPAGRLTAGAMQLTEVEDKAGSYVLVFNGGVRLIYDPAAGSP